jgi:hypothetical protein
MQRASAVWLSAIACRANVVLRCFQDIVFNDLPFGYHQLTSASSATMSLGDVTMSKTLAVTTSQGTLRTLVDWILADTSASRFWLRSGRKRDSLFFAKYAPQAFPSPSAYKEALRSYLLHIKLPYKCDRSSFVYETYICAPKGPPAQKTHRTEKIQGGLLQTLTLGICRIIIRRAFPFAGLPAK